MRFFFALTTLFAPVAMVVSGLESAHGADPRSGSSEPIKALLVIGGCCHDYVHQKKILADGISARTNIEWTVVHEGDGKTNHRISIFENADWAKGMDVVVHDECCSGVKDLELIERVLKPHKEGLPAVVLHCGMHCFRSEGYPQMTPWFAFTGLQTTGHGKQLPIEVAYTDPDSAITKGLGPWTTVNEELYNNITGKVLDTAHPLASGAQGANTCIVAWTNNYNDRARVFATTLGHNNATVGDARYLDLVTRGLLWSLNKLDDAHLKPAPAVEP